LYHLTNVIVSPSAEDEATDEVIDEKRRYRRLRAVKSVVSYVEVLSLMENNKNLFKKKKKRSLTKMMKMKKHQGLISTSAIDLTNGTDQSCSKRDHINNNE